jgi:hypothetical protein
MERKGSCSDARSGSVQQVDKRKDIHGTEVIDDYKKNWFHGLSSCNL